MFCGRLFYHTGSANSDHILPFLFFSDRFLSFKTRVRKILINRKAIILRMISLISYFYFLFALLTVSKKMAIIIALRLCARNISRFAILPVEPLLFLGGIFLVFIHCCCFENRSIWVIHIKLVSKNCY